MKQFTTHVKNGCALSWSFLSSLSPSLSRSLLRTCLIMHWPLLFFQLIGNKLKGMLPFNKSCFVWLGLTIITCVWQLCVCCVYVCVCVWTVCCGHVVCVTTTTIGRQRWCWQLRESDHRSIRSRPKNINSPRSFCPPKRDALFK